ncbi:hypothetical protein [Hymenobacter aerophilus]|uniref:hypothetical protein n=1 Tax=Hymenobacter aerophilus TaxID=119644 RepID=UPI0003788D30|nr:hypothetical protein [Hymenobacter aerophilus]
MPAKTAYQKQADKRTKDALRLRARYDARARKYAGYLMAALVGADDARARLDRVNLLYGVDISTETILIHDLRTADTVGLLGGLLGQSVPGEEVQLPGPTVDGNGGLALGAELLFGEIGGSVPVSPTPTLPPTPPPTPTPPPPPAPSPIEVTELRVELSEGSWSLWVGANSPSGSTLVEHPVYAGEFITCYNGRSRFIGLGAKSAGDELVVKFADAADSTITTTRTITLEA